MFGRQRNKHNPGKFRSLLTLRASSEAQADSGDVQPDWTGAAITVRGCWVDSTQRMRMIEGGKFSEASGIWEIPWVPNLTNAYRVEFGTRYYRIIGIDNLEERNRELHLYVVEDEGAKGVSG